ncbi:MAG TPA: DUF4307 domain-containing protein [Mycobacteriales bacterium]|nr:DUF4307 domain-containing protein [Mycobacteriales bacterium]
MRTAKYAVVAIGVVLTALMVFVVFFLDGSRTDIAWRTISVQVGDPKGVTVTFEVDKPPLTTAECQVAAFDAEQNDAGRLTKIEVGPSADGTRTTRKTVVVPTPLEQAASAAVATCRLTRTR